MNLPNSLTTSRFGFAGLLMICLSVEFPYAKSLALVLFVMASITDCLDGHLARTRYGVTNFGRLMDPLADKIMVSAVFVGFVGIPLAHDGQPLIPAWVAVIIVSREFMVTGLRLLAAGEGKIISAGIWGKHKTVWQMVAIIMLLVGLAIRYDFPTWFDVNPETLDRWLRITSWIASSAVCFITIFSGWIYLRQHWELVLDEAG